MQQTVIIVIKILNEMISEKLFKFGFEQMKWQIQIEYCYCQYPETYDKELVECTACKE